MDQTKIGEYIAKLRKQKGMTQEQLGEKLGISGKSVSKWERGLHLPDLNNLVPLADILGTNVNVLLNGGINSDDNFNDDKIIVNNIKAYSNKYRKKYLFMFFVFIVTAVLLIVSVFFYSNYDKNKMYYITGDNSNYYVNGYFVLNPERNILIIRNIRYNNEKIETLNEPKLININISILLDDIILGTYNEDMLDQENYNSISDILNNISIVIDDNNIDNVEINDDTSMKMIIEYIDANEVFDTQEIKFKLEKIFSSDKIVYN